MRSGPWAIVGVRVSGQVSVPQVDTPLLLDVLLGLIVLLFVPFGIRRGVAKESMVSAGILLGATLAERFGDQWGQALSRRFSLDSSTSTFAASTILLLAGAFLLGYGGGAALGATRPGMLSRLTGGLLAAFNGAFLVSYLLLWVEIFLRPSAPLDRGIVSQALLRQTDQLLLYAAGVLLVLTVIGWIVNAARSRRQPHALEGAMQPTAYARQRPVGGAASRESGKYEPGTEPGVPSGRFGAAVDATSPLAATDIFGQRGSRTSSDFAGAASNGHARTPTGDQTNPYSVDATGLESDQTVWTAWSSPGTANRVSAGEPSNQWPVAPSIGVTGDERCAVCRARVGPRDVFCPECGATL